MLLHRMLLLLPLLLPLRKERRCLPLETAMLVERRRNRLPVLRPVSPPFLLHPLHCYQ